MPIKNKEETVESFVLLNRRDGKFFSSGIGQAPFAAMFLDIKGEMRQKARLIRIPGMNIAYIGIETEEGLSLISLTSQSQRNQMPRLASTVFAELTKKLSKGEDVPR